MRKLKKGMSLMLVFILALSMTLATGCSKKEDDNKVSKQLAVTVDDKKIYMDDMMYYIYLVELQGNQYDEMYKAYFGTGYWDTEYEEGVTIREKMKSYIMDTVVMNEILYDKAIAEKYELTDEEVKTTKENTATMLENVTEDQLKITGFTEDKLLDIQEKLAIAYRYQTDIIDAFDIDDAAITATISKEDNRQYNTEYMLFPTTTTDASGASVAMSDADKKTALKNATAALEKAKAGTAFADIIAKYDGSTTNPLNFVAGDQTADAAYETAALKLKNDEYSEIVETDAGYYVIKMTDNNSTESYDTAVSNAITTEETTQFNAAYEKMKADYKITVNEKVWDTIVLGNITTAATTKDAPATDSTK